MEFARSVSMMNGMFLRMIIGYQKSLGEAFSEVYRTLYKNEFEKDHEDSGKVIDYELIEAVFPPPATLNMTNLQEQIGSAQTIAEYVVNVLVGATSQDEKKREYLYREATKDIIPNINWSKYEDMLDNYKMSTIEEKIRDAVDEQNGEASFGGGMGGMDAGGFGGDMGGGAGGGFGGFSAGGNTGANPNDVNGTPNPQTSDLGGMNAPADDGNMPEDEDFY